MVGLTTVDGVATVTLDDPASANALGERMVHELSRAFERAAQEQSTRAVVLTAVGDAFSHGAPRDLLLKLTRGDVSPSDIRLPKILLDCPVPIVAAMAGHATGGGFALGLSADIVVLAEESRYGFTFMNLGFTPGMGSTALCEHVLSPAVAHELLYTGELRRGRDLVRAGVNHIVQRPKVLPLAFDIAARIALKPRVAVEALKQTLSLPRRQAFERSITTESLMHRLTFGSAIAVDRIEGRHVE